MTRPYVSPSMGKAVFHVGAQLMRVTEVAVRFKDPLVRSVPHMAGKIGVYDVLAVTLT
jgi:hypothetical protein